MSDEKVDEPTIAAAVYYAQARLEEMSEVEVSCMSSEVHLAHRHPQGRGLCFRVFDGTNPRTASPHPLIHPSAVRIGDIVHLKCHLLLQANIPRVPEYKLHIEAVTVMATSPDGNSDDTH